MAQWIKLLKAERYGPEILGRFHLEDGQEEYTSDLVWGNVRSHLLVCDKLRALLFLANNATQLYCNTEGGLYRLAYSGAQPPQMKWIEYWAKRTVKG
jgi:hypothetical protein